MKVSNEEIWLLHWSDTARKGDPSPTGGLSRWSARIQSSIFSFSCDSQRSHHTGSLATWTVPIIMALLFMVSNDPQSVVIWEYYMEYSRNKQFIHLKLHVVQRSALRSHAIPPRKCTIPLSGIYIPYMLPITYFHSNYTGHQIDISYYTACVQVTSILFNGPKVQEQ